MTGRRPGPSLVVLPGRDALRRIRPKVDRALDLRLVVPVAGAWPILAFWGLVAPLPAVCLAATGAAVVAGFAASRDLRAWKPLEVLGRGWSSARGRGSPGMGGGLRSRPRLAAGLALLGLMLMAAAGHRALRSVGPVEALAEQRAVVTITGAVSAEPRSVGGPSATGRPADAVVVRIDVDRVRGRGEVVAVQSPVLVVARSAEGAAWRWGARVEGVVRLEPSEPGADVVAVARPRGSLRVTNGPSPVLVAADQVRDRFRSATDGLWPDARALVPALVVGDTSRTPRDLDDAMRATGLSHVSAVSGTNVTLVLVAVTGLGRLVGVPRRWRPAVGLVALVGFVVLARPEPSVVRAAVMGVVGLVGLSTSRRRVGPPALAGAVLVLLLWDPWLARSFGFTLSTVATLGLLVFARPWGDALARRLPRRLAWLGPVIAVPVAAQAVCAPLVVPLQGSVSLVAVLANLLAAPFVAPTTIVGVIVAVVAAVSIPVAGWLAWGAAAPAQALAAVARRCSDLPGGSVPWGESAWAALLLAVLTLALIALGPWVWHHSRHRPAVAFAVAVLTTGVGAPTTPISWPPPGWVLIACDVGQGDGIVVDNGAGHLVVIDTGPDPVVMRRCLDRVGAVAIDLVVLTHFHADHVGGLAAVLERPVAEIRGSTVPDPPEEAARVARLASRAQVPVGQLRSGESLRVGQVSADVWWPARRIDAGSVPNNASVVLTLHVRGVTFLLAGDIEREAAAQVLHELARAPARWGSIDVLKVAHHGSSNRDDRLLDHVDGRLALVSVGADNDYGHPAPSTMQALGTRGFEVHRTDLEGDIAIVADGRGGVRAVSR